MDIAAASSNMGLVDKTEIDKARLLAFYVYHNAGMSQFTTSDICSWFEQCSFARPNASRLRGRLETSTCFVRGAGRGTFRLHARDLAQLAAEYPWLTAKSEEVVSHDWVLSAALYQKTRGYIECLAQQINACYEHNLFDGCAVLMRRLLEIMLILAYEKLEISGAIRDGGGNYLLLEGIVADAKSNTVLSLSRNTKANLDEFRKLGNYSAHKIHYNARREDIKRCILDYRAAFEELLYKAGIRV